jgi:cell division protein FtsW (lipid II flippase)
MARKFEKMKSRYCVMHIVLLIISVILLFYSVCKGTVTSGSAQAVIEYEYVERPLFAYSMTVVLMMLFAGKMQFRFSKNTRVILCIVLVSISTVYAAAVAGLYGGFFSVDGAVRKTADVIGPQFLFLAVGILSAGVHISAENEK